LKPSVFQTDKENQKCAGGAHSKRTVSTVPVDPTSFSWWWFSDLLKGKLHFHSLASIGGVAKSATNP
jgi:hypothetical protein